MGPTKSEIAPTNLDELVTRVATTLMGVDSTTLRTAAEAVLRVLVEYFEVDLSFLRFHDTARRATVLVAEWPPREVVPDPDPLGVISFESADPAFAASEHLADILIIRPSDSAAYQERVKEGSGVEETSVATVPLRSGGSTTGTLGFIKYGDRGWNADETRALRTIATLIAQMQARLLAEDQLRHIAHHDELTGLPNRRALLAHLQATLTSPPPGPRALLFIDVDRLKATNDFLGHDAGDRFIIAVAERIRSAVGVGDMVARLGGDEFVVALAGLADEAQAATVAARVQRAMAEPIRLGGQSLRRTVSVGIAVAQAPTAEVGVWLRSADQAVLTAKDHGGNEVVTFTSEMRVREEVRVAVEMSLLSAIRDGTLAIHYQPVVDLRTGTATGVEALLRWYHPTLGPVSPELFVGVAEATNLAGELGRWVLDGACRQLAAWRRERPDVIGGNFTMAVNISPVQLLAVDFVDTVAEVLARHGLTGRDLVLEVTEHAVVGDADAASATLRGLRRLGVCVAIDDFGTGYSSLAQLKALPVMILKIDRGFVQDLGRTAEDLSIVRSIVGLAQSFGLDLIAEGVETELAAETLLGMGCTTAQGYLFSRPLPAEGLLNWVSAPAAPAVPSPR
ncbi:putative bifunctional diguanylate cyclase/phosphodiesterase [Actinomycetospora cinnamomea]|uniref:Diguanylate cyclase/phosphodiesterase with GAF sensor n=1 Tax=Actinomycetospora cinnamomea TaxID=663609 RepID=A0A2U1EAC5_9PSEU|nr:bifunctional diguanylate cyclase/phosphodiesterase [Actinomycetospora cinnamomea]PVY96901.1 diguanylate cyclase/phosphodiesterase with GAF sensor [Actinomycetospora cinnamomea]